jgi:hypothetical protein
LVTAPPERSFEDALAAQQAAAGRFLSEVRKTRGHYAAGATSTD